MKKFATRRRLVLFLFVIVHFCLPGADFSATPVEKTPKAQKIFTAEDALSLEALGHYSSPRISCRGEFIAYAVTDRYYESPDPKSYLYFVPQGSHIFVYGAQDGKTRQLTEDNVYSWSPSWSPDGQRLAFYAWHENNISIGIWDRKKDSIDFRRPGNLFGRRPIFWSLQNDKIFYFVSDFDWQGSLRPYDFDENPIIRESRQEPNPYDGKIIDYGAYRIAFFDINSNKSGPIMPEAASIFHGSVQVSPDGKTMSLIEIVKNKVRVALVPTLTRLVLYPVEGGTPLIVASDSKIYGYSWSPDGQSIAYIDDGKMMIYSLKNAKSAELNYDGIEVEGEPIWHPDGKEILCTSGDDFALFDASSGKSAKLEIGLPFPRQLHFLDEKGEYLYFKTTDLESGAQAIYRVGWKGKSGEALFEGDMMISDLSQATSRLVFTLQNTTTPENIWTLDLKTRQRQKISYINRQASGFSFGKSELISWENLAGDTLKGVLLYPADYEPGKKYPVIFEVYSTFSGLLHRFFVHLYNLQILTNRGYAVFLPDLKFYDGDLPGSYLKCVEPAMDKLIEMGIADGSFGVMGHSFGGYGTNVIAAHSKRFKAAVALSGMSNYISYHGTLPSDYGRGYTRGTNELGGAKLDDNNPEQIIDRYIKNSPVFFLHKVQTPLMLIHGTEDWTVPFSQAEEMYYGLRHLGKPAVLVGYPGEGHLWFGTKERVFTDMWERICAWFDKYVKS